MLHLSFTQQLCQPAKIKRGNAANDAIFGLQTPSNGSHPTHHTQSEPANMPYIVLRKLAQRYLIEKD